MTRPSPSFGSPAHLVFDMDALVAALRLLDDRELARVEDDLDFYHFTGFPSDRLRALMAAATPMSDVA